jgi:imidazoleglycerol-phosphate dehydratase/histidinol-phosphatase
MKRVLFIDRDGTLIVEPEDFQVDSFEKFRLLPGVITYLGRIAAETDYELVMVSNQDGLGTDSFPETSFYLCHNFLLELLAGEGINFADVFFDRSFGNENKPTRKPNTGMLTRYIQGDYDLQNSYVIGDRTTDVILARNLGAKAIFVKNPTFEVPTDLNIALTAASWREIYDFLRRPHRRTAHRRTTSETDICVALDVDGTGQAEISTGISFFDHMLEQLARHALIDIVIDAKGDLYIDKHHTVEDVAITLGEAFSIALADKRGMERYGFCLPMDDCLAQVALDFGGRNWLVWDAEFKREKIGEMPTEMFFHFFK